MTMKEMCYERARANQKDLKEMMGLVVTGEMVRSRCSLCRSVV